MTSLLIFALIVACASQPIEDLCIVKCSCDQITPLQICGTDGVNYDNYCYYRCAKKKNSELTIRGFSKCEEISASGETKNESLIEGGDCEEFNFEASVGYGPEKGDITADEEPSIYEIGDVANEVDTSIYETDDIVDEDNSYIYEMGNEADNEEDVENNESEEIEEEFRIWGEGNESDDDIQAMDMDMEFSIPEDDFNNVADEGIEGEGEGNEQNENYEVDAVDAIPEVVD